MSQYLVLAHFPLNRETRWDVGIPGVYVAFSALGGRLQSSHCQATAHQQENNTSRDQCECTYTQHTGRQHMLCWHTFKLNLTQNILKSTWATQHCITLHTCTHALLCASFFLVFYALFHWSFESIKTCVAVPQSLFERQGMTLHGGLHPGIERGHIPLPKGMSRTKSFGKTITHPVHIQIRWMIVYLMYSMLIGKILKCRKYKIRKLHYFFHKSHQYTHKE